MDSSSRIDAEESIYNIFRRRPFYSIFNANPTKVIKDGESDEGIDESGTVDSKLKSSEILYNSIDKWKEKNKNLFDNIDSAELISIFAYMFNKTFTALNLNKSFRSRYEDEHLSDWARRFEFILVNSAMTASIKGSAVNANVALTKNYNTLRDYNEFKKYDRTIIRNEEILNQEAIKEKERPGNIGASGLSLQFIQALWTHPIFVFNNRHSVLESKFPLGKSELDRKLKELRKSLSLGSAKRIATISKKLKEMPLNYKEQLALFIEDQQITKDTNSVSSAEQEANLLEAIKIHIEEHNAGS